jgi:hypothetical protein
MRALGQVQPHRSVAQQILLLKNYGLIIIILIPD